MNSRKEDKTKFVQNNKQISKAQLLSTEVTNKIALSSNNNKRMLSIDSIEPYAYGRSKDLILKKEKIKRNNIIKQHKND